MRHIHDNVQTTVCIASQNLATTSKVGDAIDKQGYGGVEFLINYGTIAASTTTVAATVLESDSSTASTFTSVADGDLLGTEALASIAAVARVAGSTSAVVKKIGYKGNKRYAKVKLKGSASAIGGVIAVLFNPERRPIPQT